ncbi:MAG: hypothetical protein RMJ98_01800 [Myxococcales bacterium]|nr:hypothetical protein [Polyangiaceae bacterium]MDW8248021.1 hypothetical protein [Myxococcales bacterium]
MTWVHGPVLALAVLLFSACSNVTSYGVPTRTALVSSPGGTAVAIFATREPTMGHELGIVEARGTLSDISVEVLFPELVRRVQELGGNALVLDQTDARFEQVTMWSSYQEMIPCGSRGFCTAWQVVPTTHEEMFVVLRGRAWWLPPEVP